MKTAERQLLLTKKKWAPTLSTRRPLSIADTDKVTSIYSLIFLSSDYHSQEKNK
jgi:hypothetical protein